MTHYKDQILVCDFFVVATLFLQTVYALFFIELSTRRVYRPAALRIHSQPGSPNRHGI